MYTIGQVSEMFNLPISTLRYYDKEGLFPSMQRDSGIRKFGEKELEALRVIECLKKSGLEIRDIKQFMAWCVQGSETYPQRRELFLRQKAAVEAEIERMNRVLDMLRFKCWYYEQAIRDGNEDRLSAMKPEELPEDIRHAYEMVKKEINWLPCPVCKGKTRTMLRSDTVLINFPLFCPKCKSETLINAEKLNITVITEPDA